jgi:hypothetical protein
MKAIELRGLKSYFALQAYGKMLLGLKMLPMYMNLGYSEFYGVVDQMPESDQEKLIREGVFLVDLTDDEVMAFARFCVDANGVPFTNENIKKLAPDQIFEIIVTVCIACAKIKINLTTDYEKKN